MTMKRFLPLTLAGLVMLFNSNPAFAGGYVYEPDRRVGSASIYTYDQANQYYIDTKIGYVTDFELRPGEKVQKIATGNSTQWTVDLDQIGNIQHVYIKPLVYGTTTNIIVNTDVRSYRLVVSSGDDIEYFIKFSYPEEEAAEKRQGLRNALNKLRYDYQLTQKARNEADKINKNYSCIKNKNVVEKYIPSSVFDNGKKTYIEIRKENQDNMPTIYYFDEWDKKKLQLVNYRLKGNFLEIDKVMNNIKLVYSQKAYLIFRKSEDKKIPAADEIKLNSKDKVDLSVEAAKAGVKQAEVVTMETDYISLKERLRQKRLREQKEILQIASGAEDNVENSVKEVEADD